MAEMSRDIFGIFQIVFLKKIISYSREEKLKKCTVTNLSPLLLFFSSSPLTWLFIATEQGTT